MVVPTMSTYYESRAEVEESTYSILVVLGLSAPSLKSHKVRMLYPWTSNV